MNDVNWRDRNVMRWKEFAVRSQRAQKEGAFSLPPLSRKWKTVRNLLVALLLFMPLWGEVGFPLPTEEMAFRRLERRNLLEPSEIILHISTGSFCHQFMGVGDNYVVAAEADKSITSRLSYWSLEDWEGIKLISTPWFYTYYEGGELSSIRGVVALDMPEGAQRAELTVEHLGKNYRGKAERMENGAWLFHMNHGQNAPYGCSYQLTVYDAQEQVLLEQQGELRSPDYE